MTATPNRARRVSPARSGDVTVPKTTRKKPAASKVPAILERDFQKQIIQLARTCGWMVEHKYGQGSVLGSKAIDRGFPDLVLVRNGQILVAEVKGPRGKVSEAQDAWLHQFTLCGIPALVWFPDAWEDIKAILTAPRPATWPREGGAA